MGNVQPLLRWIPASAGMTMYTVMPDLISLPCEVSLLVILLWGLPCEVSLLVILLWGLPCEILFCFVFNRVYPVLDTGHPERKQGQQRQLRIAECGLGRPMNKRRRGRETARVQRWGGSGAPRPFLMKDNVATTRKTVCSVGK